MMLSENLKVGAYVDVSRENSPTEAELVALSDNMSFVEIPRISVICIEPKIGNFKGVSR